MPPPYAEVVPTGWLTRRRKGRTATLHSYLLESPPSCLTPTSCPSKSFCPFVGQGQPPGMPSSEYPTQDLWESTCQLTQWQGKISSAPHNPAHFSSHTPTHWLLTTFTRWPGVAEMSQVHSFRLGYLSGQFGLLIVPSAPLSLCSQPAREKEIKRMEASRQVSHGNHVMFYMLLSAH